MHLSWKRIGTERSAALHCLHCLHSDNHHFIIWSDSYHYYYYCHFRYSVYTHLAFWITFMSWMQCSLVLLCTCLVFGLNDNKVNIESLEHPELCKKNVRHQNVMWNMLWYDRTQDGSSFKFLWRQQVNIIPTSWKRTEKRNLWVTNHRNNRCLQFSTLQNFKTD